MGAVKQNKSLALSVVDENLSLLSYIINQRQHTRHQYQTILNSYGTLYWKEISFYQNNLSSLDSLPEKDGVYIIAELSGKVIYVGKGNICQRLRCHLRDDEQNDALRKIVQSGQSLCAYYATTPSDEMTGIELYLYNHYRNNGFLTNEYCPCADSSEEIVVNLPDNLR